MNVQEIYTTEEEMVELLNECYDPIDICGYTYDAGYALNILDPTAIRCMANENDTIFECGECGTQFDNFEEADECCVEDTVTAEDSITVTVRNLNNT